ncbi:MAG: quinone oxidoreductase [Thermoanaerobaculia bacterium]
MHAVEIERHGGPEALTWKEMARPDPGKGEVLVRVGAAGVNFIDVYHRTGRYPTELPYRMGLEGCGVVEELGRDVSGLEPGDRVAWSSVPGSYAEFVRAPADKLVKVPKGISDQEAAAVMLQGMTAQYLSASTFPLKKGDVALVHAAAGGVGLLLVQMAKSRGAKVIGTASTREKAKLATDAGADQVILYTELDFELEVKRLTGGGGVDVVYDGVGKATFLKGLDSLRPLGMMVLFGGASGAVEPFDPILLSQKGSLFLTRPTLFHYTGDRESLVKRATEVLEMVASKRLRVRIERTYPLEDASLAHRDLESRKTTGKLLLIPPGENSQAGASRK